MNTSASKQGVGVGYFILYFVCNGQERSMKQQLKRGKAGARSTAPEREEPYRRPEERTKRTVPGIS